MRCVALAPQHVTRRAPSLLEQADRAIAKGMAARARGTSVDEVPRLTFAHLEDTQAAVSEAANWLSWAHPGVRLRRARLDALVDAHEETQRAAYAALVEELSAQTVQTLPSGVTVRPVGIYCSSPPTGLRHCYARFALEGEQGYMTRYARTYTLTRTLPRALPRFVRQDGEAKIYECELEALFPRGRPEDGPSSVIVTLSESANEPGVRMLLRHIEAASD